MRVTTAAGVAALLLAAVIGPADVVPAAAGPVGTAGAAASSGPPAASGPTAATPPTGAARPVLVPTKVVGSTAPAPTRAGLEAALAPLVGDDLLGSRSGAVVVDPATGEVLFDRRGSTTLAPASTVKVVTMLTALRVLGLDRRIATRVVQGASPSAVVLVGGGDASLVTTPPEKGSWPPRPSLTTLASTTAAALRAKGTTSVALGYDSTLFAAPYLAPGWPRSFPAAGVVAPVTALMVDEGRVAPGSTSRTSDPAAAAARAFARLLRAKGVQVTDVAPATAPAGAKELARVQSAPVQVLVQHTLTESDNQLAEALTHLAGVQESGRPGTFASGAAATLATVKALGLPTDGVTFVDGSGLSRDDDLPPVLLARALAAVATQQVPYAWPVSPGLPVAGLTGTLDNRFRSTPTRAGAGVVRAKTGTLTGVVGLAGLVRDVDGRLLAFAVISDEAPSIVGAREVVDRFAARLAGCGCR